MEDDLKKTKNGRQPQKNKNNGRQPQKRQNKNDLKEQNDLIFI